ncbi:MAG: methyltransferase domain-containing protein [Deltaproteobacteria bacterium]|nr:methyltransferase domain-containing protein [Deltaproteobacteria bacterium]
MSLISQSESADLAAPYLQEPEDSSDNDPESLLLKDAGLLFGRGGSSRGRQKILEAVGARLQKLDLTMARYLARLRREPSEWDELLNLCDLRAPDTFFRFPAQFEVLADLVSERAALASDRTLRVLSAGCRRGHEAFSLAIILASTGLIGKGWKISVDGFDQSLRQVALAKEAKFSLEDLSFLDPSASKRWFEPRAGGWRFKAAMGPKMDFFQANVFSLEEGSLAGLKEAYDVILCRGLSFDCPDRLTARLARNVLSMLAPEGLLLTAPGEIWPVPADVSLEERDGVVYARRNPVRSKANVFFSHRGKSASYGRRISSQNPKTQFSKSLVERFHELIGPDPEEAREAALELLNSEMEMGFLSPGSLDLMLRVEERLGRSSAAGRLSSFLEAWEGGE